MRSLSDRQRRSLYNIALRHRLKLLEAPHIIKAGCTSNPEAEFYDAIRDDYVKEGHPPLPSVTKTKEYLRKLSENKRQSRSGKRVKKLLAIRDIRVWQARLMILLDKLVSRSSLRRNLIAIGINLDDAGTASEAMFSPTFLKVFNGAYRKCSRRGPPKASSIYSSDESDDEQSDAGAPFTPESSPDFSSKAQTPISSIENDFDTMELQDGSPDSVRQELHNYEGVCKEKIRLDKRNEEALKSQSSSPLSNGPGGVEEPGTCLSQQAATRSEAGLFVTQSPYTPANTRRSAEQDCQVKSPASARDEQVLDMAMSIDRDCTPTSSRAASRRAKDDRRKQKQKYRRQRTTVPQIPCPIEDGLVETAQSTSPVTRDASVELGCEPIVPLIESCSVAAQAPESPDSMRQTPELQTARPASSGSVSSDDPFSSPVPTTRQSRNATSANTRPVQQAQTISANRSTLERENSEHRKMRSKRLPGAIPGSELSGLASKPRLDPTRPVFHQRRHTRFSDSEAEAAAKPGPPPIAKLQSTTRQDSPGLNPFRQPWQNRESSDDNLVA